MRLFEWARYLSRRKGEGPQTNTVMSTKQPISLWGPISPDLKLGVVITLTSLLIVVGILLIIAIITIRTLQRLSLVADRQNIYDMPDTDNNTIIINNPVSRPWDFKLKRRKSRRKRDLKSNTTISNESSDSERDLENQVRLQTEKDRGPPRVIIMGTFESEVSIQTALEVWKQRNRDRFKEMPLLLKKIMCVKGDEVDFQRWALSYVTLNRKALIDETLDSLRARWTNLQTSYEDSPDELLIHADRMRRRIRGEAESGGDFIYQCPMSLLYSLKKYRFENRPFHEWAIRHVCHNWSLSTGISASMLFNRWKGDYRAETELSLKSDPDDSDQPAVDRENEMWKTWA